MQQAAIGKEAGENLVSRSRRGTEVSSVRNSVRTIGILPVHRLLVVNLYIIYGVLLVALIKWVLQLNFAYDGFSYTPIDTAPMFLWTWGLMVIPAFVLPIQMRKPSQFITWLLTIVVYVPAILIPPYSLGYRMEYADFQGVLFACVILLCIVGALPAIRLPEMVWSLRAYVLGLLLYSVAIMGWIILQIGFPTSIPTFSGVYEQRTAYDAAMSTPGPLAYLIAWQPAVINPLMILIGLTKRRWSIVGIGIGLNVLMYSLAGHKSHLLSSVLVVGVFVMYSLAPYWRPILLAAGTIVLMLATSLLYWGADQIYPISILVRRLLAVPGLLSGFYFDYFSSVGYTQQLGPLSVLFSPRELPMRVPNLIGLEYFGDANIAANANLWADGFSAFGYAGMVLVTLIFCVLLWVMDSLGASRPLKIATPLFVISMYSLTNSAMFTSLLTHGILFSVLMIFLYPTSRQDKIQENTL